MSLRYNILKSSIKLMEKYIRTFIIFIASVLIALNLAVGFISAKSQISRPAPIDPSIEFADLKERLQGIRQAGFLSEKNSTAEGNDGRFLLAQYTLAPTVLDLNNPAYRYNVLSCSTPQAAISIMMLIGAQPIYINTFGKIIAERPLW